MHTAHPHHELALFHQAHDIHMADAARRRTRGSWFAKLRRGRRANAKLTPSPSRAPGMATPAALDAVLLG